MKTELKNHFFEKKKALKYTYEKNAPTPSRRSTQ